MQKEKVENFDAGCQPSPEAFPLPENYIDLLKRSGCEAHVAVYKTILRIAEAVKDTHGRAFLVGGCIRDLMLGEISKDFDLEVHGVEPEILEDLVKKYGEVHDVGRSFGVLKLCHKDGVEIDISFPRTDSKMGTGHKGFSINANPFMGILEAARRRDFTINSMAADPLNGNIYDPFGGIKDLREKRLKITDPQRFGDDPLRALRAMQMVARFDFTVEPDSRKIIQEIAPLLAEIPPGRILVEWKKLLLKAPRPSRGLGFGNDAGIIDALHPELSMLVHTPQDQEWHPEGNVWIHTLKSLDAAAIIVRREKLTEEQGFVIMLSTLTHDLGKPEVTTLQEGRYISHGHETAGKEPALKFLTALKVDNLTRDKVVNITASHLSPALLYETEAKKRQKVTKGAIRRLSKRLFPANIYELVLVAEADHLGRGQSLSLDLNKINGPLSDYFPAGDWLRKRAQAINVENRSPANLLDGRDFLELGYQPGRNIGKLVELANLLRDDKDFSKDMVLEALKGIKNETSAIDRLIKLLN